MDVAMLTSRCAMAETSYTAFEGTRHAVTARLIVRRVVRDDPNADPRPR
jgi:hypothetical protein